MIMADLHLNLKKEYFDAIKAGTKKYEYRKVTPYWSKRLEHPHYINIILKCGYPRSDDQERIIKRRFVGWHKETITHPHFGNKPVEVYAIHVGEIPKEE
ncbi:hypothetical protein UNDYM_1617 [Undibacterium sp. YM2]|nr:hypothetical protein UNDYM_1617 [Undibacterium sp. YM2]